MSRRYRWPQKSWPPTKQCDSFAWDALAAPELDGDRWRKAQNWTALPHLAPRRCGSEASAPRDSLRAAWAADHVAAVWRRRAHLRAHLRADLRRRSQHWPLRVLEIGPCRLPCRFAPLLPSWLRGHVVTHAADFSNDTRTLMRNCGLPGHQLPTIDVVTDAQTLAGVADGSYDALIAFHVLEHMADPIGAIGAWLRVVRRGGCVLLGVPDVCGTSGNADRLRLPPTAAHLLRDHRFALEHRHEPAPLLARSMRLHGAEASVTQGARARAGHTRPPRPPIPSAGRSERRSLTECLLIAC